jgi:hypothetical protein
MLYWKINQFHLHGNVVMVSCMRMRVYNVFPSILLAHQLAAVNSLLENVCSAAGYVTLSWHSGDREMTGRSENRAGTRMSIITTLRGENILCPIPLRPVFIEKFMHQLTSPSKYIWSKFKYSGPQTISPTFILILSSLLILDPRRYSTLTIYRPTCSPPCLSYALPIPIPWVSHGTWAYKLRKSSSCLTSSFFCPAVVATSPRPGPPGNIRLFVEHAGQLRATN